MSSFDALLATAELTAIEIQINHHVRQISLARDRATCLIFATKLGALAAMANHAAAQMKERLCRCGTVVWSGKVKICPGCGRSL